MSKLEQYGATCWCGNDYFKAGSAGESFCDMTCNKDGSLKCGGKMVNSIYTGKNSYY